MNNTPIAQFNSRKNLNLLDAKFRTFNCCWLKQTKVKNVVQTKHIRFFNFVSIDLKLKIKFPQRTTARGKNDRVNHAYFNLEIEYSCEQFSSLTQRKCKRIFFLFKNGEEWFKLINAVSIAIALKCVYRTIHNNWRSSHESLYLYKWYTGLAILCLAFNQRTRKIFFWLAFAGMVLTTCLFMCVLSLLIIFAAPIARIFLLCILLTFHTK